MIHQESWPKYAAVSGKTGPGECVGNTARPFQRPRCKAAGMCEILLGASEGDVARTSHVAPVVETREPTPLCARSTGQAGRGTPEKELQVRRTASN